MNRQTLPVVLLVCLHFVAGTGGSQSMEQLTVENGLSQGFVPDMLQTRDGFLWMATLDGLNRYDGVSIKVYGHDPLDTQTLSSHFVLRLYEDSREQLWVVTDKGLDCLDRQTDRFYTLPAEKATWLKNGRNLIQLIESPDGHLWGLSADTLYAFEFPEKFRTVNIPDMLKTVQVRAHAIPASEYGLKVGLIATDTALWIGSRNTIVLHAFRDNETLPCPFPAPDEIYGLWRDSGTGAIWVQSRQKMYRWRNGQLTEFPLPVWKAPECSRGVGRDTNAFFFTLNRIYHWDGKTLSCLPQHIPEGIQSACLDRDGILWIGTNAAGVRKIVAGRFRFPAFLPGVSLQSGQLTDRYGRVWIYAPAEKGRVFQRLDEHQNRLVESFGVRTVQWLIRARNDTYWYLSPQQQLCCQHKPGGPVQCFPFPEAEKEYCRYLFEDRQGKIVCFSDAFQLIRFDPLTRRFARFSFGQLFPSKAPAQINVVREDRRGALWIGTTKGLVLARPRNGGSGYDFQLWTAAAGQTSRLSSECVLSLIFDPEKEDIVWIGTQHGLNRLEQGSGQITQFSKQTGFPNDVICGILPGGGHTIWLSTYYGLLEFDTRTADIRHFTTVDGLPANEFNQGASVRLPDGRLLFGGVNGFTLFKPEWVKRTSQTPRLRLTELLVNNNPVRPGASDSILKADISNTPRLVLRHDQSTITLCFALLDYFNPSGNRYYYRLEGVHNDWQNNGAESHIIFVKLPPGKYVFYVKAHNSEGLWSEPVALEIEILPPWWLTWWAYIGYAVAVGSLLLAGLWFWTIQVGLKYRLLAESRETERLKELDHFKSELYANITHEFRTPITVILGLTEQLGRHLQGEWKAKTAVITRNGEKLLRLIQQILDLSKIEESRLQLLWQQLDMVVFLQYLGESMVAVAAKKNVAFRFELPAGPILMDIDPQRLQEVLQNLLSNAFKFTPAGGAVRLELEETGQQTIKFAVEDNGIGIAPEHLDKIFDRYFQANRQSIDSAGGSGIGLAYCKALVELMGGSIRVFSTPGKGSRFVVELPLRNEAPLAEAGPLDDPPSPAEMPVWPSGEQQNLVLIIEDDTDVAEYIASCLAGQYAVQMAENGRVGLEMALESIPDIVISDISMPGRNGLDVCRTLKADRRTSHIPVVLLTARIESGQRLSGLEHGADVYLTKPFLRQELLLHLQNLLRLRAGIQARFYAVGEHGLPPLSEQQREPEDHFLQQVFECINKGHVRPEFGIPDICRALSMSNAQLHRKTRALTGQPPGYFLRRHRLEKARQLLLDFPDRTVAQIAFEVGFADPSYFARAFTAEFGTTPGRFRDREG